MILKSNKGLPKKLLFNAAGGAFLLMTVGLVARSAFVEETLPPCTERYPSAMMFSYQQPSGAPLSPQDLQAKLAGRDWGVIENVSFVKAAAAPAPVVMQVKLAKATRRSAEGEQAKSGMGFTWLPRQLATAQVACLSYSVWLPEDFAFETGGNLPGLFGGEAGKTKTIFSTRIRWRDDAVAELRASNPEDPDGVAVAIDNDRLRLPRNRWFKIEQEIALNTPGADDGAVRVWVDGVLKSEAKNIAFRNVEAERFLGVTADVFYDGEPKAGSGAPKDAVVRLSPLELRWR